MIEIRRSRLLVIAVTCAAALLCAAAALAGPQASITLKGSDAALCNVDDIDWSLTKTTDTPYVEGSGPVSWTVSASRIDLHDNHLTVNGYVQVQNTGAAPATIGNVVVNLQRCRYVGKNAGSKWVSASVDVADATHGDAATTAKIVAAASAEVPASNALFNSPPTYTVSGAQGTFTENAASGTLEFTDADSNTLWAITPQRTIPAGGVVNLLFVATFNNTISLLPDNELLRAEVIVSFGNCALRGGSGASAAKIDINGNGLSDSDEAYVRSVPTRPTRNVPSLVLCNDTVTLTDPGVATTRDVTASSFDNGGIGDGVALNESAEAPVTVDVDGGAGGGTVGNTAYLDGEGCEVGVIIGYDVFGAPIYHYFPCCLGLDLEASSVVEVGPNAPAGFSDYDFYTYGQGAWGAKPSGGNAGQILAENFASVYPGGFVEVGIPGSGGFSMKFTSALAIQNYLPASGAPGVLTADLVNPTSSSANAFGGHVLALQLTVDFSAAGITQGPGGPLGSLTLCNTGASLDGQTVAQILAVANTALGGGGLPTDYSLPALNDLLDHLTNAFSSGLVSAWATQYLCY